MAYVQTRRSISVRGTTYDRLRAYCDQHQRSMSDVVEELLAKLLEGKTVEPALPPVSAKKAPRPEPAVVAHKVVRAPMPEPRPQKPAAPVPAPAAAPAAAPVAIEGRPAPTPAQKVVPERVIAPKDDYRNIQF